MHIMQAIAPIKDYNKLLLESHDVEYMIRIKHEIFDIWIWKHALKHVHLKQSQEPFLKKNSLTAQFGSHKDDFKLNNEYRKKMKSWYFESK